MKFNDLAIGVVFIALAIFIAGYATTIPPMAGQRYGAAVFPYLVAVGLAGFSVLLFIRGWRAYRPGDRLIALSPWALDPYTRGNFILAMLAIILYVALDDIVGFMPLAVAMLVTLFVRQRVAWGRSILIAVLATVAIEFTFGNLLRVPLPRGFLTDYMW